MIQKKIKAFPLRGRWQSEGLADEVQMNQKWYLSGGE